MDLTHHPDVGPQARSQRLPGAFVQLTDTQAGHSIGHSRKGNIFKQAFLLLT